jgi:hypothetical protein
MREWLAKLTLSVASLLLVGAVLELGLRFVVVPGGPPLINLPHERLGHVLKPNLDFEHLWDARESQGRIRTNALGMRQADVPETQDADAFRILMLGDSYTFGYGVDDDETFSTVLERSLNRPDGEASGRTVVLNAGVPSYGTGHQLIQFETAGRDLGADLVVLNVFLGNDIQDNLCVGYVSLAPHQRPPCFAVRDGVLQEITFDPVPSESSPAERSFGERVARSIRNSRLFELASQQGGRALTSNAWLARLLYAVGIKVHPGYSPHVVSGWYNPRYAVPGWELTRALLMRLRDDVVASGARFAIVMIPSRIQVLPGLFDLGSVLYADAPDVQRFMADPWLPQRRIAGFAREQGIPVLDLGPVLGDNEPVDDLYFPIISHWNAAGHRVATQAIAEFLAAEELTAQSAPVQAAAASGPRR